MRDVPECTTEDRSRIHLVCNKFFKDEISGLHARTNFLRNMPKFRHVTNCYLVATNLADGQEIPNVMRTGVDVTLHDWAE